MFRYWVMLILGFSFCCGCADKKKAQLIDVRMWQKDSSCRIEQKSVDEFSRAYGAFFRDRAGNFFILSSKLTMGAHDSLVFADVFVQMPALDSASFVNEGMYMKDDHKVVCVFANSDGGNYVEMKGVDARTFRVFQHVFGGRDRDHVYFQDRVVGGVNPSSVKVYSAMKGCGNCDGYFKDGDAVWFGDERITAPQFKIPAEYVYVE